MILHTLRHAKTGRLEVLGQNTAIKWLVRLERRERAKRRLAGRRRSWFVRGSQSLGLIRGSQPLAGAPVRDSDPL